jgi:hypothetical protein
MKHCVFCRIFDAGLLHGIGTLSTGPRRGIPGGQVLDSPARLARLTPHTRPPSHLHNSAGNGKWPSKMQEPLPETAVALTLLKPSDPGCYLLRLDDGKSSRLSLRTELRSSHLFSSRVQPYCHRMRRGLGTRMAQVASRSRSPRFPSVASKSREASAAWKKSWDGGLPKVLFVPRRIKQRRNDVECSRSRTTQVRMRDWRKNWFRRHGSRCTPSVEPGPVECHKSASAFGP